MDLNIKQLPQEDQEWRHNHTGNPCMVIAVANTAALDHEKFPVTVVYQNKDGSVWSRPASSFIKKFSKVK